MLGQDPVENGLVGWL